jgi:hypothetical protein
MQIIAPTYITDSTLISCDIPAASASYPEWDDTVSYITGQRVSVNYLIDGITPGVHIIYECTWHGAGNIDMYPPDHLNMESGYYWWTRISATERWKLFDMIVAPDRANASANVVGCDWESGVIWESGTTWATDTYASMQVTVQPGLIDTVALMNLDASTVSIIMDDPSAGEVYNETDTPSTSTYYNAIFEDLPAYPNATTQLIIRNYSADVNVGEAIFGKIKTLGKVRPGVNVGLVDYSQKQTDAFGGFSILERAFSKRLDCNVMIPTSSHSGVMRILEKYRSTPLVWIVSANYSTTLIYGYYRDFKMSVPNLQITDCSLSIEGLGGDMVNATPIPDPWVDPWDGIIDLVLPPVPTFSISTSKIEESPVAPDDSVVLTIPSVPTFTYAVKAYYLAGTDGVCTISHAEPALVTITGHGLINDQEVLFHTTGVLPEPLEVDRVYFVMYLDVDTFNISLTIGGSSIDTSTNGSGTQTAWGMTGESP